LQKYEDDPGELTVHTRMDGTHFEKEAARDVNFLMQANVDKLQRQYVQQSTNLSAKHTNLLRNNGAMMMRSSEVDHLSEFRQ
jgi:hypothetical protein